MRFIEAFTVLLKERAQVSRLFLQVGNSAEDREFYLLTVPITSKAPCVICYYP